MLVIVEISGSRDTVGRGGGGGGMCSGLEEWGKGVSGRRVRESL